MPGRSAVSAGSCASDHPLEPPQLGTRLDPELIDDQLAPGAHRLERLGLPAGPVQRDHQLAAQLLPQRVLSHQATQIADQVRVVAAG